MGIQIYCDKCGRAVALEWVYNTMHRGECLCGFTVTARNDSNGKMFYTYHETNPPDLCVKVSDGIGAEDVVR